MLGEMLWCWKGKGVLCEEGKGSTYRYWSWECIEGKGKVVEAEVRREEWIGYRGWEKCHLCKVGRG